MVVGFLSYSSEEAGRERFFLYEYMYLHVASAGLVLFVYLLFWLAARVAQKACSVFRVP